MSVIDEAFIRAYQSADHGEPAAATVVAAPAAPITPARPPGPRPHFRPLAPPAATQPAVAAMPEQAVVQSSPRRPLSELIPPPSPVETAFQPALEVDRFRFDPITTALTAERSLWNQLLAVLSALHEDGRTVVGIAGAEAASGCSTVATCLARLAAQRGTKTALVDADFVTAGLARKLGLVVELGWDDVLAGRVPLAEAAVHSLGDRFALLPLAAGGVPAAEKLDEVHGPITAGVLRYHHDLVLVDLGTLSDDVQGGIARRVARQFRLDAVLLVDAGNNAADRLLLPPELAEVALGVIENRSGQRRAA